jgi:NAD(P)-dependent dehydrogenase (short-subunit alcohol dehydrogenase family)
LNYNKRTQVVDLSNRIILLTGGRVKIGYRAALKLLRCGATVIVTTRFPADATRRCVHSAPFSR